MSVTRRFFSSRMTIIAGGLLAAGLVGAGGARADGLATQPVPPVGPIVPNVTVPAFQPAPAFGSLRGVAALSNVQLGKLRGGWDHNGLSLSFGFSTETLVNGQIIHKVVIPTMPVINNGHVVNPAPGATPNINAITNSSSVAINNSGIYQIVQNSMAGYHFTQTNAINYDISGLSQFTQLGLTSAVTGGLLNGHRF